jgi:hypothetical protein
MLYRQSLLIPLLAILTFVLLPVNVARTDPILPPSVKAVWDLDRAWSQTTPTRQRICINGLWRWQPAAADARDVPADGWGYFEVPGCWPGISDYMLKDSQVVYPNPKWTQQNLGSVSAAWYQRQITVPNPWTGRHVVLSIECLNSYAIVFVDGGKVGEIRFPAGEVDLTNACPPGQKHILTLLVMAMPLKAVMQSYADTAAAREVKGKVDRRGLCGDVYLISTPPAACISQVMVQTSVRKGTITVDATLRGLADGQPYTLRAEVLRDGQIVKEFLSSAFKAADLPRGHAAASTNWKPDQLWDLHTPQNVYDLRLSLLDNAGRVLDTSWGERFGFRELWIDGRDFYLNGTRIFLSAVPLDNAQIGAATATYQATRETLRRLKSIGINFVYTHNYGCEPGSHLSFDQILRAADDEGMLVALSQPHFAQYDWKAPDADASNGYASHAAFYAHVAANHPSVVFYSMSHNATGYAEDMNPDLLDGLHDPRDQWSANNAKLALRAEAIVRRLDPTRIVYHHAGGNIGAMHTMNFYPNFAPIQELSDWYGHWAKEGVKPAFMCEYGAPFTWDWTMYRGWYQGKREFGSAAVPWEFCLAEWDAQFLGDRPFAMSQAEKANLRWEAQQFGAGKVWHRWDYPTQVGSPRFADRQEVLAMYTADNWRAYRTWGVSGISPWEYEIFWTLRDGVHRARKDMPVDWDNLQRPGFSPDYIDHPMERMDIAYEADDWIPTDAGKALLRNNQPVLAYIGGKPDAFTSKDHNFRAGESVEKQLILINDSRRSVTFACRWSLGLPQPLKGEQQLTVETGQQARIPLRFQLPAELAPGPYELRATARFGQEEQADTFTLHVLPTAIAPVHVPNVALYDPKGETATWLDRLQVPFRRVSATDEVAPDQMLIIGKLALNADGPGPNLSGVNDGLKVLVLEQSADGLEKRLGFRVTEYGLRCIFPRIPDHPILAGLDPEHLRDWRGQATTVAPRRTYDMSDQRRGPTVQWCGIPVTRVWRCGNRGNVASVLIEKPTRGDFRPILDGGYSLQYSPLMEYRQGKGLVLFCQLDVTGRTEDDPAAQTLAANSLRYLATWKPSPTRQAVYAGDGHGRDWLHAAGIDAAAYDGADLSTALHVLILGPGSADALGNAQGRVVAFVNAAGQVLAIGAGQRDVATLGLPQINFGNAEHIAAFFPAPPADSPLTGIGCADILIRSPRDLSLVSSGSTIIGDGVLALAPAAAPHPNVILCQLAPWQFSDRRQNNLRRTYRRTSFLVARLLANLGVAASTPLIDRFHNPPRDPSSEKRWLEGLYIDDVQEWDDPYRFFRW